MARRHLGGERDRLVGCYAGRTKSERVSVGLIRGGKRATGSRRGLE